MGQALTKYDTEKLVEALKLREKQAFSYLYDNYSGAVYGALLRSVKSEVVAQELLQDVFMKIWKSIDTFQPQKGNLFAWMLSIARNRCIDWFRVQRLQTTELDTNMEVFDHPVGEPAQDHHELAETITKLKAEQRILIEMVYWGGFSHEETATQLNLPLGTVKTRIRSALKDLRKIYAA